MNYDDAVGHARRDGWSSYAVHGTLALDMCDRRWRDFRRVYPHCPAIYEGAWIQAYRASVRSFLAEYRA